MVTLVLVLFLNACNREQDGDSWGPGHRGLEEGCLVRRKKILLVVYPVVVLLFGQECLVYGEEDGSSWRGSLVSGERRRFMNKVLVFFPGT